MDFITTTYGFRGSTSGVKKSHIEAPGFYGGAENARNNARQDK